MLALVTGGSGFIGSFISQYLKEKGMDVLIPTRNINKCNRITNKKMFKFVQGDISNNEFLTKIFESYHPDIVIHLAWDGISGNERNKYEQINNLIINQNLLENCGKFNCKLFIGFGSQAEYGVYNKKIDESFLPKPDTLYGVYKLSAGLTGKYYASTYGFKYAWLRLFSTFGPKDNEYYIIPYTIKSFLMNKPPELTLCEQKWDYIYVKDIPSIIWKIIEKKDYFCDIYNLCSNNTYILKDIILHIKNIIGSEIEPLFGKIPYRKNNLFYLHGDNKKFKETFGWVELTDINKSLKETIGWFKCYNKYIKS